MHATGFCPGDPGGKDDRKYSFLGGIYVPEGMSWVRTGLFPGLSRFN